MARGKKTCPKCEAEVGPRLKICGCGHEFTFKQGKVSRSTPVEKPFEDLTENPNEIIGVKDHAALRSFIGQLKQCDIDTRNNGGCYSAFLRHLHGTLQVEIQFPMKLR